MSAIPSASVGFFGKVPALGDFVSRRLPRQFIDPWDQWLQASLRSSQETLGENWLSSFLVSPLWRFALSPGLCGPSAWAGVMMPSVDRVGRYYPLTLAQPMVPADLMSLFLPESTWFSRLEDAALSVLNEPFDLDGFDKGLTEIGVPAGRVSARFQADTTLSAGQASGKLALRYDLDGLEQAEFLFPHLSQSLIERFLPCYSVWATEGVQASRPNVLFCEGLPPIDAYAGFLTGVPQAGRAWQCQAFQQIQNIKPVEASSNGSKPEYASVPEPLLLTEPQAVPIWNSYGVTVVGNKRKQNEDAMLNCPAQGVWVVADGMGGHQSGDLASRLVVDNLSSLELTDSLEQQIEAVCARLQKINEDLCRFAAGIQLGSIIGTTVVVLLAKAGECAAIWAGDSRLYQLRRGQFRQITRDHTLIDELMDSGLMTREIAEQQVGANVITRAVGGQQELALDVIHFQAEAGDRYLLCSDGLDKELSEAEIAALMANGNCQLVAETLINQALSRSGRDNITVVVSEFGMQN